MYTPECSGEKNDLPSLPRPPDWESAITVSPCSAPAAASDLARLLVESSRSWISSFRPIVFAFSQRRISISESRSGEDTRRYPRLVTALISYPLSRSWFITFHTALRLTPSSRSSSAHDTVSPVPSSSSALSLMPIPVLSSSMHFRMRILPSGAIVNRLLAAG